MKRLLWLGAGLAIGALVVRAVTKAARSYSPQGVAAAARDSGRNLVDSVREFIDDVREGMHERERELRAAFAEGVAIADLDRAGELEQLAGPDRSGDGRHQPVPPAPEDTTR